MIISKRDHLVSFLTHIVFSISSLMKLSLEGNRFGENTMREFANSLKTNSSLLQFNVDQMSAEYVDGNSISLNVLLCKNAELMKTRKEMKDLQLECEELKMKNAKLKAELSNLMN